MSNEELYAVVIICITAFLVVYTTAECAKVTFN